MSTMLKEELHEDCLLSIPDDCVCGRGKVVMLRALKLYVVRSTAQKHGGTMEVDLATDTVNINVPKKEMAACTKEIAKQLEPMGPGAD
jgi:hypothetical protein